MHNVPKPFEYTPAPGEYDGHLKPIGAFLNKITMGSKYEFKSNSNPGPGYYESTRADEIIKNKSQTVKIMKSSSKSKTPETSPAPG